MNEQVPPVYAPANPPPLALPPPPPAKRGRGWKVTALLLMLVLFVILARDFVHFAFSLSGGAHSLRSARQALVETTIEDNDSAHKIAVLDVEGLITGDLLGGSLDMVTLIKNQLKAAAEDKAVKAVVLKVDSPGGEVMASDTISRAIAEFQKSSRKPVVASFGSLAASGGYYVSAPCRWIVAHELTITGSIGVIMHGFNYRGLMDKVGIRPEVFKSGRFKDMLRSDKSEEEILPEERRMIQAMIDQTYARFKEVVAAGRNDAGKKNLGKGRTLEGDWEQYADGRILSGREAFQRGFVDELGDFESAVKSAQKLAGLSQANLIRYEIPFDITNLLRLFVKSEVPAIKLDLGLDALPVKAGRLYFLAPVLGR